MSGGSEQTSRRASLRENLKHLALRYLPDRFLRGLKKRHYRTVVSNFPESDEPDLAAVRQLVSPGQTVYDIGANIGVYTRFLSEFVGPSGCVESFEPIPPTFSYLQSTVGSLNLRNVSLNCIALCDRKGTQTMNVPQYGDGAGTNFYQASLINAGETGGSVLRFDVATDSLDNFWRDKGAAAVAFMKIDVEGAELTLLENAKALLAAHHPAMLVEISGEMADANSPSGKLRSLLEAFGYTPFLLVDGKLRKWVPGNQSVNYFFLTERQFEGASAKL